MSELDDLDEIANLPHHDGRTPRHNLFQLTKTHCVHGHEFSPENTRVSRDKKGHTRRICRACHRIEITALNEIKKERRQRAEYLRLKAIYEPTT